jgi:hypothetical protein
MTKLITPHIPRWSISILNEATSQETERFVC